MLFLRRVLLLLPWVRRARERDLAEELRAHVELASDDARDEGFAPDEARRSARVEVGNITRAVENVRELWTFASIERTKQDLRYALRGARRAPAFTLVAVGSLGAGVAAATIVFSIVNTVLLKPLPYPSPDRIVYVREIVPPLQHLYPTLPANIQHFDVWRRNARSFDGLAAVSGDTVTLTGSGEPQRVDVAYVSSNLFDVLQVQPRAGRSFLPNEERAAKSNVAIISDALWHQRFGGAEDVVGRPLIIDGVVHTIVGVLPSSFWFPAGGDLGPLARFGTRTDVFRPLAASGRLYDGWGGDYDYVVFGRLARGVSPARARAELDALERRIVSEHQGVSAGLHVALDPLKDVIAAPVRTGLYVLLLFVDLLLLIVCVNLASLLLARTTARTREFAIRTALGAGRARLFQQVVLETALLVGAATILGLAAAAWGLRFLARSDVLDLPRTADLKVDLTVVGFAAVAALASALIVAWLPASRIAAIDPERVLRGSSNTVSEALGALRLRGWLVGAETAISTVLLVAAGLLVASLGRVLHVDRGFAVEHALGATVTLASSRYRTPEDRNRFFDRVLEGARSLPGVTGAAFVSKLPLTGESQVNGIVLDGKNVEAVDPSTREMVLVNVRFVSPDYFRTLGIRHIRGRSIEPADRTRKIAVISERLAAKVWPGQNPLGRKFETGSGVGMVEVVGVVGDVPNASLEQGPTPIVYVPFWGRGPTFGDLVIRTAVDETSLVSALRRTVWNVDPEVPLSNVRTIGDLVSAAVARRAFQMRMAAGFAAGALLFTLIGISGVVAYAAAQRRKEIGIRIALGARSTAVLRAMIVSGLKPVAAGLLVGIAGALAGARFMRTLLFGVSAADPLVIVAAVSLLAIVATLATMLPARAAARTDPVRVLRSE